MNVRVQVLVLSVLFSATTNIARGQEESAHEAESEAKNELGVFTGVLSNLTANESGPSIGADFTRELTEVIGLLVLGEFAKAGEREALVAGGVVLRPGANIKVVIAPGVILEKEHELGNELHEVESSDEGGSGEVRFVGRLGVGDSFEVSTSSISIYSRAWTMGLTFTSCTGLMSHFRSEAFVKTRLASTNLGASRIKEMNNRKQFNAIKWGLVAMMLAAMGEWKARTRRVATPTAEASRQRRASRFALESDMCSKSPTNHWLRSSASILWTPTMGSTPIWYSG